MRTIRTSFFRILRRPGLHHRYFAPSKYISHALSDHASIPSPLQPVFTSLQRTRSPGSRSRLSPLRKKQNNSSLTIHDSFLCFYCCPRQRSFVLYVLSMRTYTPSQRRAITQGMESQDATCVLKHKLRFTICQRRYSIQPLLKASKSVQAHHNALDEIRICVAAHMSAAKRTKAASLPLMSPKIFKLRTTRLPQSTTCVEAHISLRQER